MGVEYVQVYKTIHNNFTLGSRASPRTGFRIESPQYPCSMFFFFLQRERERQRVKRKPRVVHLCVDQSYPTHSNSNYIHPSLRQTLRFVFLTKIRDIGWLIEFVEWHHFLPSALGISFNIVLQSETNKGVKVFFFFFMILEISNTTWETVQSTKNGSYCPPRHWFLNFEKQIQKVLTSSTDAPDQPCGSFLWLSRSVAQSNIKS